MKLGRAVFTRPLSVAMQGWVDGGHLEEQEHPLDMVLWGHTAWRRADKDWARLSWSCASSQEAAGHSHGSGCWLPAHPAAWGSPGQGRAESTAWLSPLMGSCSPFFCSRRGQQQKEEKRAALALCSVVESGHCPGCQRYTSTWDGSKYSPQMMHPLLITQNCNWKMSFSLHGMTQLNGLLSAEM